MEIAIITGAAGLIGSEAVNFFSNKFDLIVGIDNDLRKYFFGKEGSIEWNMKRLQDTISNYKHYDLDIRNNAAMEDLFKEYNTDIKLVLHTAAQPSHDWAAKEPFTDFSINATGTLNLLEMCRLYSPAAIFIFTSTNKVYGDTPNFLPLKELERRWEIDESHPYYKKGIDESMSIDQSKHSLFGASKVAADVMVQEFGRYFGMPTCCLRGGCLTGPNHAGVELHGFLNYLVKCNLEEKEYKVFGYKGKQVRDNIHSYDVARFIHAFINTPRKAEVYNIGGGRANSCSIWEAFTITENFTGKPMLSSYIEENRIGDHICYISNLNKMKTHYPAWDISISLEETIRQIVTAQKKKIQEPVLL